MSILGAIGGIAGSVLGGIFGDKAADKQADLQREFATHGIRWKVKDAEKAGIHPLYALGAQTTAYSPVSVGGQDWANAGQNMGSAIQAMTTPKEKLDGFAKTVQGLTLDKMGLENEILRSQLRMVNQPGRGPGMPGSGALVDGQGDSAATINIGGYKFKVGSQTAAQTAENEYGEIGGEIAGASKLFTDLQRSAPNITLPQQLGNQLGTIIRQELKKLTKPAPKSDGYEGSFY